MDKFQVFSLSEKNLDIRRREKEGAVPKDWVRTSEGDALFKDAGKRPFNPEIRNDWPEKIVSESSDLLGLPAARYELAQLETFAGIKEGSISFKLPDYGGERIALESSFENIFPKYNYGSDYSVVNVISILEQQNVQLPPGYSLPEGINDGVDLFVGALMLDAYTVNIDRHCRNFDLISLENEGVFYFSPIFDNGRSLGSYLQDEAKVNRSISNYATSARSSITIDGYSKNGLEVFQEAARLRPKAAKIWQNQLSQISTQEIENLFRRVPDGIITPISKEFAVNLLEHNQAQLLSLDLEYVLENSQNFPKKSQINPQLQRQPGLQSQINPQSLGKSDVSPLVAPDNMDIVDFDKDNILYELVSTAKYVMHNQDPCNTASDGKQTFQSSDLIIEKDPEKLSIQYDDKLVEFDQDYNVVSNMFEDAELYELNQKTQAIKTEIKENTPVREIDLDLDISR